MDTELAERRKWFNEYCGRNGSGDSTPPALEKLYSCPCCGYPTLPARGGHDICELCDWEDEGQDDPHADEVRGGHNGSYSLSQARENFQRYGLMYSPESDPRIVKGDNDGQWAAKQGLIRAFEAIRSGADPSSLQAEMESCRRILRAEAVKKVRRFQRSAEKTDRTSDS